MMADIHCDGGLKVIYCGCIVDKESEIVSTPCATHEEEYRMKRKKRDNDKKNNLELPLGKI
jgi:hypothetical protein